MSLEINVYCKQLTDALIPKIVKRLNEYEMKVETHPDFSFSAQDGYWPFKFELVNPRFDMLKGKVLETGFELYISDFDLTTVKEQLKSKPSLWDRLLRKPQTEVVVGTPEIEERLKNCTKVVSFIWHVEDSFQARFVTLASAILTELTDGVCSYPADNIWYENEYFVDKTYKEVLDYEMDLTGEDVEFKEFDKWA